jgi:hypothetical protein
MFNDLLPRFCEALMNTSSFGDVPGVMRLASMIHQQGIVLNSNLCLQVSFTLLCRSSDEATLLLKQIIDLSVCSSASLFLD